MSPIFPSLTVIVAICGGIPRNVSMPKEIAETPPDEKHQRYAEIIPIRKIRMILNSSDIYIIILIVWLREDIYNFIAL